MASQEPSPTCTRCSRRFTKRSSLVRHSKRCLQALKAPPRQKACQSCANSKLRCDLRRPICGRCRNRTIRCEYHLSEVPVVPEAARESSPIHDDEIPYPFAPDSNVLGLGSPITGSNGRHAIDTPHDDALSLESNARHSSEPAIPNLMIPDHRRSLLLGTAHSSHPSHGAITRHTAHFVTRVLRSWPRMMASHHTNNLPPVIHRIQLTEGTPTPLANCYTLVRMWAGCTNGSYELVQNTVYQEVRRLLQEYPSYDEINLLAAAQSLAILLIILLFGLQPPLDHSLDAQLLVDAWDIKNALAKTGLFLKQELNHTTPPWKDWAMVSAKRRTVLAFHHIEWAWSVKRGYPILTCFELGPLPAPAAKHLWYETNEGAWNRLYEAWLRQWVDGCYRTAEFFDIANGEALDERSEMWLAEVDEFGMMLMAEVNGNGIGDSE